MGDGWKVFFNGRRKWIGLLMVVALVGVFATYGLPDKSRNVWSTPLSGKVIVLDPGHGGPDGGAVSQTGLVEKDVALSVSLLLRDYLQESGALVIMTRDEDRDLAGEGVRRRKAQDLLRRGEIIRDSGADALISIHLNAIPSSRWSGAQTFYYPTLEANEILAQSIQGEMIQSLQNTTRQARHSGEVYILKTSEIPSALVEIGFLSNPEEAGLLGKEDYQKKVAAAIYHGILRYYSEKAPTKEQE